MTMLPHDLDAERSVLATVMTEPEALQKCIAVLAPKDFYDPRNRVVWGAIKEVAQNGSPVDEVTVLHAIRDAKLLAEPGKVPPGKVDLNYFIDLTTIMIGSGANADYYAKIIKDTSYRRDLIQYCQTSIKHALEGTKTMEELRQSLCTQIASLKNQPLKLGVTYSEALAGIVTEYEKAFKGELVDRGHSTGYEQLDNMVGGFLPQQFTLLAARTSMGKSAFMLQIMRNLSAKGCVPLLFSLEMGVNEIIDRLVSSEAQVDNRLLRKNKALSEEAYADVLRGVAALCKEKGLIDDSPGLTVSEIKLRTAIAIEQHNVNILFVDYLGLVDPIKSQDTREREVALISRTLKQISKELNIPVIALCQLNRGVEARQDKHPQLSDLRDSGSLEQDADIVMMLYRDEYYNQNSDDKGIVEVTIAKHRNGPCGTIRLRYMPEFNLFRSAN
jgi:replicative DNA helicase